MNSAPRLGTGSGQRALLITTLAVPLTGWTVHAVALHRRLAAARRDPLTGLLSRDGYTAKARQILDRYSDTATVIMCDLDHFKQINDTLGHAAGDAVIAATAERLSTWAGSRAAVGRLGGDEFFSELTRASRDQVTGRSVLREPVWGRRTAANGAGVSFLPVLGHQDETRAAYDGVVDLYASMFANGLETHPFARNMIGTFAELVRGTGNLRVADVGCGPGHVTAMLHDLGLDAFGLDLSPAMVDHARRANPALQFDEARMEALPVEDGALGGVLSHYSMIHTPPGELPALLAEQVRVLAPGGLLLVSFFGTEGPEPVRFDHKVTPAYSWPAEQFAELLAGAGLVTFARLLHDPASERGFLDTHLLARRP